MRLLGTHPRGWLVKQQQARLAGQRHRNLQRALLAVRQILGATLAVPVQPNEI